jgi:hypothetical protein
VTTPAEKNPDVGPVPRLGDHLEQTFLVRVEAAVDLQGKFEGEAQFRRALAENFAAHPVVTDPKELAAAVAVVWRGPVRETGLPPDPAVDDVLVHCYPFTHAARALAFVQGLTAAGRGEDVLEHRGRPYRPYDEARAAGSVLVQVRGPLPGPHDKANAHNEVWHFEGLDIPRGFKEG